MAMNPEPRTINERIVFLASLLLSSLLLSSSSFAQVPHLIRYQGQAVDASGVPLEGPYDLTVRLYAVETGGTPLWEEPHPAVPLAGGHFSLLLGSQVSLANVEWTAPLWLAVQVNGEPELAPRQQITSVPMAIRAEAADRLTVAVSTSTISDDDNRLVPSGAVMFFAVSTCPAGWTALTSARGRYVVGVSPGGALAGTVGIALADLEHRPTGQHTHSLNDPGHAHRLYGDRYNYNGSAQGAVGYHGGIAPGYANTTGETTGMSVNSAGNVSGTNAPYIQLLVCQKD